MQCECLLIFMGVGIVFLVNFFRSLSYFADATRKREVAKYADIKWSHDWRLAVYSNTVKSTWYSSSTIALDTVTLQTMTSCLFASTVDFVLKYGYFLTCAHAFEWMIFPKIANCSNETDRANDKVYDLTKLHDDQRRYLKQTIDSRSLSPKVRFPITNA